MGSPLEPQGTTVTMRGADRPERVVINTKGKIVFTSGSKHCITMLSYSRKEKRSIGTYGSGKGQFKSPHGVAVDDRDNI